MSVFVRFSVRIISSRNRNINYLPSSLSIGFKQPYVGRYQDRLELLFEDTRLRKRFIITQDLKAIIGNKEEHEELQPKTPHSYILHSMSKRNPILEVVPGIKPLTTSSIILYVIQLPKAHIPTDLGKILSSEDSVAKMILRLKSDFMPQVFNSKSHGQHFKHLLWIEEFRAE